MYEIIVHVDMYTGSYIHTMHFIVLLVKPLFLLLFINILRREEKGPGVLTSKTCVTYPIVTIGWQSAQFIKAP